MEIKSISSFTGFPVITKLPWDPIVITPGHSEEEEEEEKHDVVVAKKKRKEIMIPQQQSEEEEEEAWGKRERYMNGSSSPPPEVSFFTGFPVTIAKLPWQLPKPKTRFVPPEGVQVPTTFFGLLPDEEDGHLYCRDDPIYDPNSPDNICFVPKKSLPWYPVPSLDGFVDTYDPAGNKIRTPFPPPPPTVVQFDPNQYPYTWKPETRDRYYSQLKDSEGFDVDPIPGVHMYSLIVPMNHLGTEKKQCELVARMAVDEYNRRYKDDKGELKFGKIIKVMVKVVAGFIYYLTVEAIDLSSEMPVTFQSVVFTGVSKDEVKSFRFISDSKKEPWLWKDDDICTC